MPRSPRPSRSSPPPLARKARARRTPRSGFRGFRAAEFFAGIGLVRLALEKTGDWRVVYANDIET